VAVLAALLSDPAVTDRARHLCAPAEGRWGSAARHALADRVLQHAAVAVFELALATLPGLDAPGWLVDDLIVTLERGVRRGRSPADDPDPLREPTTREETRP
jgi:glutamate--cysteine ligase